MRGARSESRNRPQNGWAFWPGFGERDSPSERHRAAPRPKPFRDGCPRAVGETFAIRYEIFGRPPNANAPDMSADAPIRLAAVPHNRSAAGAPNHAGERLERETCGRERFDSGADAGGEYMAREIMGFLDELASREGVDALCEFLSKIMKNGGGEREQARNEKRRAAKPLPKVIIPRRRR